LNNFTSREGSFMSASSTHPSLPACLPLSALDKITIGALIAGAVGYGYLQILIGVFVAPIVVLVVGFLLVAGLIVSGWRWAPLVAALYGVGIIIGAFVFAPQYTILHLQHPDQVGPFIAVLLGLTGAALAVATGGFSTWRMLRGAQRATPLWAPLLMAGVAGLILGALLAATIAAANPATSGSAAPVAVGTVHLNAVDFVSSTAVVARGGMLHLVDDGNYTHVFRNGSWNGTTAHPEAEPGAPQVNDVMISQGSIDIGPFTSAGTFHIYCTVHPGMSLTVIVP
jgi:MFS family permease